ncbi:hypothetical protein KUV50_15845 [Membranicola marinus]|uniref:Uncharacterized protein n=1 Tax=Membranihabitans marinus TaxID=1227546 RepID=A0A953HZL4_9BACT|nr:hypothetical protein [Membranihabitans marinus]MBY5959626.1 hypothetical protein [Membranihabitans marinus]
MAKNKNNRDIFTKEELVAHGVCPDCWNNMAYYNEYMTFVEDRTKADIHGPDDKNKAFIEEYVQDNITGIQLKNDQKRNYCPTCEKDYLNEPGEVDDQNEAASEKS